MYESLDFINPRYTIYNTGTIYDEESSHKELHYFTRNGGLTVQLKGLDGKWRQYKPARLCAEMFVPNPLNERHLAYKDGNEQNICASNLVWCSSPKDLASRYIPAEERTQLRIAIHDAIDAGNWQLAEELGKELDAMDEKGTRAQPSKFPAVEVDSKIPVQMGTILEVTDKDGNHLAYGSTKEITEIFHIPAPTLYKRYTSNEIGKEGLKFTIVALVPKTMVNATIQVIRHGNVINEGTYSSIALQYDIHFEDLYDLLYTNDNDKTTYNGLEFKMKPNQKKVPTDYSKGVE